jgi:hypothetical protein
MLIRQGLTPYGSESKMLLGVARHAWKGHKKGGALRRLEGIRKQF